MECPQRPLSSGGTRRCSHRGGLLEQASRSSAGSLGTIALFEVQYSVRIWSVWIVVLIVVGVVVWIVVWIVVWLVGLKMVGLACRIPGSPKNSCSWTALARMVIHVPPAAATHRRGVTQNPSQGDDGADLDAGHLSRAAKKRVPTRLQRCRASSNSSRPTGDGAPS